MNAVLSDDSLDLIFRSARTFNDWLDRPVDARVRDVYDLMK
jgi:3-hydroxypropanoate dehydrogenase